MHANRVLSVAVAVVVVLAIGLSASTLGSSMSTDPNDAVDVDYDALPVGDDSATAIESAAQGFVDQYEQRGDPDPSGESEALSGDGETTGQSMEQSESGEPSLSQSDAQQQVSQSGEGPGEVPTEPPFDWRRVLLVVALLLAAGLLGYRYRSRLAALLAVLNGAGSGQRPGQTWTAIPDPENDVQRAWVELVSRAGVSRPQMRTPRDCARIAVERGYDHDAVNRLRRLFEDVQYGTGPPSDDQERRAMETLRTLEGSAR